MVRTWTAIAAAAVTALALSSASGAAPPMKTITGSVGPGFTIGMKAGGKKVTKLAPGTYRLVVKDSADIHDFHLVGPGVDRVVTTVPFTGTKQIVLKLKKGTYRFDCDPHASEMNGTFTVA